VQTVFIKAILAGWLIALMVWMLPSASSKLVVVSLVTYFVGLAGLAHIIAGSAEAFYAALIGAIGWQQCLLGYQLPALLGNVIGGVALVAALTHAQVAPERAKSAAHKERRP
jgi:formate/nitrite transporter FocA (FNT family)